MAKEAVIAATHQKGEATVKKSNHSKFILMCLFLIIDIALNSTLDYDNYDFSDRNLISGLFGVQVIVQITVFLILFLAAADTFLFQVAYFLFSIVVGSLRSKQYRNSHTLVDNMNNDTFFYVSLIQKLVSIPYYVINIQTTVKLEDPVYFNRDAWISLIKEGPFQVNRFVSIHALTNSTFLVIRSNMSHRRKSRSDYKRKFYETTTDDTFLFSQDDQVTWEEDATSLLAHQPEDSLTINTTQSLALLDAESESSNLSYSFSWKAISHHQQKEKEKSSLEVMENTQLIDELALIQGSREQQQQQTVPVEGEVVEDVLPSLPVSLMPPDEGKTATAEEGEWTEEDLRRIDEEVERFVSTQAVESSSQKDEPVVPPSSDFCLVGSDGNVVIESQIESKNTAYDSGDDPVFSEQNLAWLEEIERQALQQQQQAEAQQSSSSSSSSGSPLKMDYPLCWALKADGVDRQENRVMVRCHRLLKSSAMHNFLMQRDELVTVVLLGSWVHVDISPGDSLHVILLNANFQPTIQGKYDQDPHHCFLEIDENQGLVILHPDCLISPTRIAEACDCMRKSVLAHRQMSVLSPPAVLGSLRHSFIEKLTEMILAILDTLTPAQKEGLSPQLLLRYLAVELRRREEETGADLIAECLADQLLDLSSLHINDDVVRKSFQNMLLPVCQWMYIMTSKGWKAKVSGQVMDSSGDSVLEDIFTIEESISSPLLGMKGQLDMIAGMKLILPSSHTTSQYQVGGNLLSSSDQQANSWEYSMLPIEFKTGKWRPSTVITHRAQVLLYLLLLRVRHYSLPEQRMDLIESQWSEIVALIQSRNQLAGYLHSGLGECMVQHAIAGLLSSTSAAAAGSPSPAMVPTPITSLELPGNYSLAISRLQEVYGFVLRGLTDRHIRYLASWERFFQLEADASMKRKQSFQKVVKGKEMQSCVIEIEHWHLYDYQIIAGQHREADLCLTFVRPCSRSSIVTNGKHQGSQQELGRDMLLQEERRAEELAIGERVSLTLEYVPNSCCSNGDGSGSHRLREDDLNSSSLLLSTLPSVAVGYLTSSSTSMNEDGKQQSIIQVIVHQGVRNVLRFLHLLERASSSHDVRSTTHQDHNKLAQNWKSKPNEKRKTNVMELLIDPFSPKLFQDEHKRANKNISLPSLASDVMRSSVLPPRKQPRFSANSQESVLIQGEFMESLDIDLLSTGADRKSRIRDLLIDLKPPLFQHRTAKRIDCLPSDGTQGSSMKKTLLSQSQQLPTTTSNMPPPFTNSKPSISTTSTASVPPRLSSGPAPSRKIGQAPQPVDVHMTEWMQTFPWHLMKPEHLNDTDFMEILKVLHFFDEALVSPYCPQQQLKRAPSSAVTGNYRSGSSTPRDLSSTGPHQSSQPSQPSSTIPRSQSCPSLPSNDPNLREKIIYFKDGLCITQGDFDELHFHRVQHLSLLTVHTILYTVYPGCHPLYLSGAYNQLNHNQQEAVEKVVAAQDYALIQGYPGTGKTSLLAFLIRMLISKGKRVCLTSFTHNALDHLVDKLIGGGVHAPFLMKVVGADFHYYHHQHRQHDEENDSFSKAPSSSSDPSWLAMKKTVLNPREFKTLASFAQRVQSCRLWVSTVHTANRSPLIGNPHQLRWDYCIIEEASQLLEALCLRVILRANVFVLVGDNNQLVPLVLNKNLNKYKSMESQPIKPHAEREKGCSSVFESSSTELVGLPSNLSLFEKLYSAHPSLSCVTLSIQYRMNADIMLLANKLVYGNTMRTGNDKVANRMLILPQIDQLPLWPPQVVRDNESHYERVDQSNLMNLIKHSRNSSAPSDILNASNSKTHSTLSRPNYSISSSLLKNIMSPMRNQDWLYVCLHPGNAVVMINTDSLHSHYSEKRESTFPTQSSQRSQGLSVVNGLDAEIVRILLWGLTESGFQPETLALRPELTILTPFRAQLQLLQSVLQLPYPSLARNHSTTNTNGSGDHLARKPIVRYEVGTVDSFQGKDCEVVIFDTVKSPYNFRRSNKDKIELDRNEAHKDEYGSAKIDGEDLKQNDKEEEEDMVGMLLKDWRRINVALTRARSKLIIVGSLEMMQQQQPSTLHSLSSLLLERGWVLHLPKDALLGIGQ
eukprot:scaffold2392_cov166-Ochromonas_danica.AAC.10